MNHESYNPPPPRRPRLEVAGAWSFEDLMDSLEHLAVEVIGVEDPVAYATGYLIGRVGGCPEAEAEADYAQGYTLGLEVHAGAPAPVWDLECASLSSGLN